MEKKEQKDEPKKENQNKSVFNRREVEASYVIKWSGNKRGLIEENSKVQNVEISVKEDMETGN